MSPPRPLKDGRRGKMPDQRKQERKRSSGLVHIEPTTGCAGARRGGRIPETEGRERGRDREAAKKAFNRKSNREICAAYFWETFSKKKLSCTLRTE